MAKEHGKEQEEHASTFIELELDPDITMIILKPVLCPHDLKLRQLQLPFVTNCHLRLLALIPS